MGFKAGEGTKKVVTFAAVECHPPLLDDEVDQKPDQKEVCNQCPLRSAGYIVDAVLEVPVSTRALPGSKESGLKKVEVDGKKVPCCFHPDRSTIVD